MGSMAPVLQVAAAALLASLMAARGLRKRSLDASGAAAAFVVGLLTLSAGLRFGALLLGFYLSGSRLTRVREGTKQAIDANYKVGGQRSAAQVLACSLLATAIAVYLVFVREEDALVIDFDAAPMRSHLLAGFVGHYACCTADTWASELGVLSSSPPRLITTLKRVPPGTNGGISLLGTAASALGGAFIGVVYLLATAASNWDDAQVQVVVLGAATGLLGSLVDSLLGATLQESRYDPSKEQICAEGVATNEAKRISGLDVLTNAQVNLVSVVLITAVSGQVARWMFS